MSETLTRSELNAFTGTNHYHRHFLNRTLYHTDGVQYLCEKAQCFWLVDEIAFALPQVIKKAPDWFYVARLTVTRYQQARLIIENGNDNAKLLYRCTLPYTSFPLLGETTLYVAQSVIDKALGYVLMLPSEY